MSEEKTELQRSLEEYEIRKEKALGMGGPKKLAKRKKEGQLNARERIDCLVDDGSFVESGLFGTSAFAKDADNTPGDGKLVGYAKIDDRDVGVVVNDFTVKGASTSSTNSKKVGWIRRTGTERGLPVIFIGESTGARLPDAMGSKGMGTMLGNDIHQFQRTRVTPWVAAALGNSFGSSAWLACCSDFVVMRKGSIMAVSSPKLVSEALKREVDLEELGGWKLHAETTGLIDRAVDTDEEAMEEIRTFLSYLPSHHKEAPPVVPVTPGSGEDIVDIGDILPERRTQVYDVRKILKKIVD
ncbi:MAG: carboxyl transferase domain-containing protein, partial [Rhodospirillales bacterium]